MGNKKETANIEEGIPLQFKTSRQNMIEKIVSEKHGKKRPPTKEEIRYEIFMKLTEPIPVPKVVRLPFNTVREYMDEYNLITAKKSKLSFSKRNTVCNYIHKLARSGKINLQFRK